MTRAAAPAMGRLGGAVPREETAGSSLAGLAGPLGPASAQDSTERPRGDQRPESEATHRAARGIEADRDAGDHQTRGGDAAEDVRAPAFTGVHRRTS